MSSDHLEPPNGPKCIEYFVSYKYAIFILLALLLFNLASILFDNNPPSLPLNGETPIDCSKISINNKTVIGSDIFFIIRAKQLIHFPQQSLLDMISITAMTDSTSVEYNHTAFQNQQSDLTYFYFSIKHSLQGLTNFTVKCHSIPLRSYEIDVKMPEVLSNGYSKLLTPEDYPVRFKNVCLNNGKIEYFIQEKSVFNSFKSSLNRQISFDIIHSSMYDHISKNNYEHISNPVFLVTANPLSGYHKIVDVLLPIIRAKENNPEFMVLFEHSQTKLKNNLRPYLQNNFIVLDRPMCFDDLAFGFTTGSLRYNEKFDSSKPHINAARHLDNVLKIDSHSVIDSVRKFNNKLMVSRRIVLDSYSESLSLVLEGIFENISIEVIRDTDPIAKIAETVSQAEYFISGNPLTLSYAIFLSSWGTLVEIVPEGFETINVGRRWAEMSGAEYRSINRNTPSWASSLLIENYMETLFAGRLRYKPVQTADLKKVIEFRNVDKAVSCS